MVKKDVFYVTDATGEIFDEIGPNDKYVKLSDGDKVVRKGVIQYLNDTVDIKYHFVKINPYVFDYFAKKYSILATLVRYVGYMDGKLSYDNGRAIRPKDIPKICNVGITTAKRQIKGLIENDVIHKVKDNQSKKTCLILNPYVAYVGRKIYLSLYEEFKYSDIKSKCKEWVK